MIKQRDDYLWYCTRKLNISIATVSRALKDDPLSKKPRRKLLEAAEGEVGYRSILCTWLPPFSEQMLSVLLCPGSTAISCQRNFRYWKRTSNHAGYNLIISQSSESAAKGKWPTPNHVQQPRGRVTGILACMTRKILSFWCIPETEYSSHLFDRVAGENVAPIILIDNRKAAYRATVHLIEQGCKRIITYYATPT